MFWQSLSSEARHLVKVADLDALERIALQFGDLTDISAAFEGIFAALDQRIKLGPDPALEWSRRYIAWARSFPERDGLPILMGEWARRTIELAEAANRSDLALAAAEAILHSYVPLERERIWWQKQRFRLAAIVKR